MMSIYTVEPIASMLLPEGRSDQDIRNARPPSWHCTSVFHQWASRTGDIIDGNRSQSKPVLSHRSLSCVGPVRLPRSGGSAQRSTLYVSLSSIAYLGWSRAPAVLMTFSPNTM